MDHIFTKVSDVGQVWGWGNGGEGQLGLGSRIKMVSSPQLIPCIESSTYGKDRSSVFQQGSMSSLPQVPKVPGSYVKGIACGGRHSAVITGQHLMACLLACGQRSANDLMKPTCVSSLLGIRIEGIAAGLWHTVCVTAEGHVYAFGGNQFGQLGTGADQAEQDPKGMELVSRLVSQNPIARIGEPNDVSSLVAFLCFPAASYITGQINEGGLIDSIVSHTPIRRIGEPNEISSLVAFLCFPAASYITGQITALTLISFFFYLNQSELIDSLASQTPIHRVGEPNEVSSLTAFLCFPAASYITGQLLDYVVEQQQTRVYRQILKFPHPSLDIVWAGAA
ncbi:hypothetical protein L1049_009328 [Liquidambar formosana]|uniref:Ultraviolet-B receptor UVR8 n=1 Tax=Liquidambar formosana TaxID=63359 RepID=A0AAP0SB35_LIQFO